MYILIFIGLTALSIFSCSDTDPEYNRILTEKYPELYASVFRRDGDALLEFTNHPDSLIRQQAWRALINTPVSNVNQLIERVADVNTPKAWASLWLKRLTDQELEYLHDLWINYPEIRSGLATVLAEQGNEETFNLLLTSASFNDENLEYNTAFALGKLTLSISTDEEQELELIRRALSTKKAALTQAYLYGFYRSGKDLNPRAEQELINLWENFYPDGDAADQFIARILIKNHMNQVLYHFPIEDYERMDVQLAVELAQGMARYEETRFTRVALNALLDHRNPQVKIETLKAIQTKEELPGLLFRDIMNKVGLDVNEESYTRLEALNTIENPGKYENLINELAGDDPYLQSIKYSILRKVLEPEEFLTLLQENLSSENRLNRYFALRELADWWSEVGDEFKTEFRVEEMRSLVLTHLGKADRSMTFVMGPLAMDSLLITDKDYSVLQEMLSRFRLPEDVEVYQAVTGILKARFEEESIAFIDSLAMKGNAALNQTLVTQGWNILQPDDYPVKFRQPDWDRLAELGPNPHLVLLTGKGEVVIRMYPLSAPATISGIDSLAMAGAYNGVPFHRVIPNFVIQGGDVETGDGFGGAGYIVPTEANTQQYFRAKVGIASAGRDTEGSQFFIMHQWKPHLNGRYSIIGEVVEGMDVADRIVQGDRLETMYWY